MAHFDANGAIDFFALRMVSFPFLRCCIVNTLEEQSFLFCLFFQQFEPLFYTVYYKKVPEKLLLCEIGDL